ncbi:hypothetical protein [Bradyrhizobium valentinum]|nr:hypothetical protein [Bradyrhizobium valentinum]
MKLTLRQVVGLEIMIKCAQRKALIAHGEMRVNANIGVKGVRNEAR